MSGVFRPRAHSRGLWVPWAGSLWHTRAGVATSWSRTWSRIISLLHCTAGLHSAGKILQELIRKHIKPSYADTELTDLLYSWSGSCELWLNQTISQVEKHYFFHYYYNPKTQRQGVTTHIPHPTWRAGILYFCCFIALNCLI